MFYLVKNRRTGDGHHVRARILPVMFWKSRCKEAMRCVRHCTLLYIFVFIIYRDIWINNRTYLQSMDAIAFRDVVLPAGLQGPQDQLMLVGMSMEHCISLALAAIQFKFRQEELYAKLRYDKITEKMASMDAHYKKKMSQMNDGYRDVKSVMERLRKERDELEQDVKELREKYGQKAKEAHNLRQSMGQQQASRSHGTGSHGSSRQYAERYTSPYLGARQGHSAPASNGVASPSCLHGHQQLGLHMSHPRASPYHSPAAPPNRMERFDSPMELMNQQMGPSGPYKGMTPTKRASPHHGLAMPVDGLGLPGPLKSPKYRTR